MESTRRRTPTAVLAAAVTAAAVVLVAVTAWVAWPSVTDGAVDIELNLPQVGESPREAFWFPTVVNHTGAAIDDATFEVSVHKDKSNLRLADSTDEQREKYPDFAADTGEICQVPADDDSLPFDQELMRYASTVSCTKELVPGDNAFSLWVQVAGYAKEAFADGKSESVTVKSRVKVDGDVVADVSQKLKLRTDPRAHRVTVEHIPEYVELDRTEADPHHGKLVVVNDSDADLRAGVLSVVTDPYSGIGLAGGDGCRNPETDSGQPSSLLCEGVDIPAGDSVTLDVDVYVNPDGFDVEKMTGQKIRFRIGTDAEGAKTGDFATKTRGIWMGGL